VLRMRNGTSESPFRLALGDSHCARALRAGAPVPDSPLVRRARQLPQMAGRRIGCALHVACAASGLTPLRTSATRPRRRLPGTTRPGFALPGEQRTFNHIVVTRHLRFESIRFAQIRSLVAGSLAEPVPRAQYRRLVGAGASILALHHCMGRGTWNDDLRAVHWNGAAGVERGVGEIDG